MSESPLGFIASNAPRAGDVVVARVNRRSVGLIIMTESATHCLYAPCDTMWEALQRAREVAALSSVDVWHHASDNRFERIASYRIDSSVFRRESP
jgi:hypothetical protein